MNEQNIILQQPVPLGKFQDQDITAKGEQRAEVPLAGATTLWFNTGTLCNIECVNCYIKSSPSNDALVYITADEVEAYLDQINSQNWPTREIAFTGGEPFMNPQMIDMAGRCLARGFNVLILTNAMRPMMRNSVQQGLLELNAAHPGKLTLRVSLDHFRADLHDKERGKGSYDITMRGMAWLRDNGLTMTVAGRTLWGDSEAQSRAGYKALFKANQFRIDASDPGQTVLFPEMDESAEVPEITSACWGILNKKPTDVMCSSSRMVVKRKGARTPSVVACTLLPYDSQFDLGNTLKQAEQSVKLNHPHCSKFCVLGGASCAA